ncbi:MAG: proline dehydrogenase family protein [Sciscionella sp.]|nr:proline dehydrogenase family protein [Sciscionella sp.]
MNPLRTLILAAAGNDAIRRAVATTPGTRQLVHRFVAGEHVQDAVSSARALSDDGLRVTLDYLGEDTTDADLAKRTVNAYLELLNRLGDAGLLERADRVAQVAPGAASETAGRHRRPNSSSSAPSSSAPATVELSVKLSAVGQKLDHRMATDNAAEICCAAREFGTTVTLDAEDHTTTDATFDALTELRKSWPETGAVVQAYLRRTESDCRALATAGSRVRLCKGAYAEPESVAFATAHDVRRSYLRCANVLLAGDGYPMFATHDPVLVRILGERASWYHRAAGSFEYQMLYGVRPDEQRRLSAAGDRVRIYVPYGEQWYGYLMRRLAERPANLAFFLRSLASRS